MQHPMMQDGLTPCPPKPAAYTTCVSDRRPAQGRRSEETFPGSKLTAEFLSLLKIQRQERMQAVARGAAVHITTPAFPVRLSIKFFTEE